MSESNPVEIVERELAAKLSKHGHRWPNLARAVIAALEREGGFKIMRREASEEMLGAMWNQRMAPSDCSSPLFSAAWDAAPSYATTEVVDGVIKSVTVKNSGAGFTSPPDSKKPASA